MSLQPVYRVMNKLMKLHIYAAMAAGLALSPIAAHAQTSPSGDARGTTTTTSDATGSDARNDHPDYGWIGLAGLLGLLGLMRKRRDDRYDTATSDSRRADLSRTRP
jgi:MYXO-CTERM domain-containing protein